MVLQSQWDFPDQDIVAARLFESSPDQSGFVIVRNERKRDIEFSSDLFLVKFEADNERFVEIVGVRLRGRLVNLEHVLLSDDSHVIASIPEKLSFFSMISDKLYQRLTFFPRRRIGIEVFNLPSAKTQGILSVDEARFRLLSIRKDLEVLNSGPAADRDFVSQIREREEELFSKGRYALRHHFIETEKNKTRKIKIVPDYFVSVGSSSGLNLSLESMEVTDRQLRIKTDSPADDRLLTFDLSRLEKEGIRLLPQKQN